MSEHEETNAAWWTCCACHARNNVDDSECQHCDCEGADCRRDNCSGEWHGIYDDYGVTSAERES